MKLKRINRLVALLRKRLGLNEEQAIDFICNAAFEKQENMPPVKREGV